MPKVSIIVPVYNQENYLRKALDSLTSQTLKDIEIICVNDGSTDKSLQILKEYELQDLRIKVINKPNSGYGATMNIGLKNASSEYVGFLEPDDFAKNTMFDDLYAMAKKYDLDIVKSDFYYYFSKDNSARKAGQFKKTNAGKVITIADDVFILKRPSSIWSAIYKKSFLDENGIKFLETAGASFQDTSFSFKTFVCAKRLMFTSKAYMYYRQDNMKSSIYAKDKVYNICIEWDDISEFLDNRPQIKKIVNQVKLSTQFNAYRWNLIRIDDIYKDAFIEKYYQTFKKYFENNDLKKDFYIKASKKELNLLLKDKKEYRKYIDKIAKKYQNKLNRRKMFSIRINLSRISIVLFGKQFLELG